MIQTILNNYFCNDILMSLYVDNSQRILYLNQLKQNLKLKFFVIKL